MKNLKGTYLSQVENNQELDDLFANAGSVNIELWDVSKSPYGHGHYQLLLDLIINEEHKVFKTTTSDMQLIDDWYDEAGNISENTIIEVVTKFEESIDEILYEMN